MCGVCHGPNGEGYKADQAPRLAQPDFQARSATNTYAKRSGTGAPARPCRAWSNDRGGPLTREDIEEMLKFIPRIVEQGPTQSPG